MTKTNLEIIQAAIADYIINQEEIYFEKSPYNEDVFTIDGSINLKELSAHVEHTLRKHTYAQ